jgi:YgiT-type zinc finger domain-containing protein
MDSQCFCRAELQARLITHFLEVNGKPYIFENVPALVCDQCGEVFFRPEVHDMILHAVYDDVEPARTAEVDVFDLSLMAKSA